MQRIEGERKVLGGLLILVPSKYKSLKQFKEAYIANSQCPISCNKDSIGININTITNEDTVIKSKFNLASISADKKLRVLFKIHHNIIQIIIADIISFVISLSLIDVFIQTTSNRVYQIAIAMYIIHTILFVLIALEIYLYSWWNETLNPAIP